MDTITPPSPPKQYKYHFGVPNELVWSSHILIGIFLVYVGYELVMHHKISIPIALVVVVLGAIGGLYHMHLWYDQTSNKK